MDERADDDRKVVPAAGMDQDNQSGGVNITGGQNTFAGDVVGRDKIVSSSTGLSEEAFLQLFQPLMRAISAAPPEKQAEAAQKTEELKAELAKGKKAEDSRVAKLVDGIVDLVPGAVSALVGMFATPILSGIAGPVTTFVLDKIRGQ
jgi:hypothetical protein